MDKVDTFVQKVGDDLGVLDEYRYEWKRLQTFNDWPHDSPRPSEMAKAGFFYSPIPEEPDRCPAHLLTNLIRDCAPLCMLQTLKRQNPDDRCAHFDSDKFFSAWEEDDDPLTVRHHSLIN